MTPDATLVRGALVVLDPQGQTRRSIGFRYDPAKLTRTLTPTLVGGNRDHALGSGQAPEERITMTVELNALDQSPRPGEPRPGLVESLAALEALAYPESAVLGEASRGAGFPAVTGVHEVIPLALSLSPDRLIPVRLDAFSVTETSFDETLMPTTAEVSLTLVVVRSPDIPGNSPTEDRFRAHQRRMEMLAADPPAGDE